METNIPEKPEIIEQKIEELQKLLNKSKEYYQYSFVCDSDWSDDMIGFFNMGNARKILSLLNAGKKLQCRHGVYGTVNVFMNPQRNRIFVESEGGKINEENILGFIIRGRGDWYVKND